MVGAPACSKKLLPVVGSRVALRLPGTTCGERTGSRPWPPKAGARLAPALRPADHRSTSAQLHEMAFRCVDMQDNIKRLSILENSMAKSHLRVIAAAAVGIASLLPPQASSAEMTIPVNPSSMPRLGTVDTRYQSYNVEMVEVTGGRFWKPYASPTQNSQSQDKSNATDLYAYRPPI